MTERRTHPVRFTHEDVTAVLSAADAQGTGIEVVKDDGVYLITGTHPDQTYVYAVDLDSPNRHESGTLTADGIFDAGWLAHRRRIEQIVGGDDFSLTIDREDLRAAAAPGTGVIFDVDVDVDQWPATAPVPLGGATPIVHLADWSDPEPAPAQDRPTT